VEGPKEANSRLPVALLTKKKDEKQPTGQTMEKKKGESYVSGNGWME
jgi:hypothetical protein